MAFSSREVVFIPFPYRDRLAEKARPAVIVSGSPYNRFGDLIDAAITSQPARFPTDYELLDWQAVGLQLPSTVRMLVATVSASRVVHKIGQLTDRDWTAVRQCLQFCFS